MERITALTVPVHGPAALAAAVRGGADCVSFRGWSRRKSAPDQLEPGVRGLDAFTAEDIVDAVEFCANRNVATTVEIDGHFTGPGVADVLEQVAGFMEIGIGSVVVSDPGLAIAIRADLPDIRMIAGTGLPAVNLGAASRLRDMGFSGMIAAPGVPVPVLAGIRRETGLDVEVTVFGAQPAAWCHACMLGQYLESEPCPGPTFGTCRREFTAWGSGSSSLSSAAMAAMDAGPDARWLDMRFFSGLVALPEIVGVGVSAIRTGPDSRSSGSVRTVTRIFRSALDQALAAAAGTGGPFRIFPEWTAGLESASMYDEVTLGFFGDVYCRGRGEPRSVAYQASRALEPVLRRMDAGLDGEVF